MMVLVAGATVVILFLALRDYSQQGGGFSADSVPLMESTINDLVFAALAVFFLYALPGRLARSRLLGQLHRLRSLAHVIDMHQLTKDPGRRSRCCRSSPSYSSKSR